MTGSVTLDEKADRLEAEMNGTPFVPAPPPGQFDDWAQPNGDPYSRHKAKEAANAPPLVLGTLGELLEPALERVRRRVARIEKAIPMPWATVAEQLGGGLWSGLHFVCAGTGKGKTQLGLQVGLHAAKVGIPVLYVGLEMEAFQIACRSLGEEAGVPWSALYLGKAGPAYIDRAAASVAALKGLPFYVEFGQPRGWPASRIALVGEALRAKHPQASPGACPALVIFDFLQLVGADVDAGRKDLRERISDAAYGLRQLAVQHDLAVLALSSVARDKVKLLANGAIEAGLTWETDNTGRPIQRAMLNPDALVGLGKESGDIESSGDSVSAIFRVTGTNRESGHDYVFATAKGRATGSAWAPLLFTGHRYEEPEDGGARIVDALEGRQQAREDARTAKMEAKEQAKGDRLDGDARLVVAYVLAHPNCTVSEARASAVANNARRWTPAVARIGAALVQTPHGKGFACRIEPAGLKAEHKPEVRP